MNVLLLLWKVVLRGLLAAAVALPTLALFIGSGIGHEPGRTVVTASLFVPFFGLGWSVLPLVRESRLFSAMAGVAWLYLGYAVHSSPGNPMNEGINLAWGAASVAILVCLVMNPPKYMRREPADPREPKPQPAAEHAQGTAAGERASAE